MNRKFVGMVMGLALAAGIAAPAGAEEGNWGNAASINPLPLIIGMVDGQYEMRLNSGASLPLRLSYWGWDLSSWKYTRIAVGGAYRMFSDKKALEGLYWGPQAAFNYNKATYTDVFSNSADVTVMGIGVGVEGGKQWIWKGGFLVDLGASVGYNLQSDAVVKVNGTEYKASGGAGIGFGFRLGLGFAW